MRTRRRALCRHHRALGRSELTEHESVFAAGARSLSVLRVVAQARAQGIEGEVLVTVSIDALGVVQQAAVLRGQALYAFGILGVPVRITPRIWLPPISPGLAVGVQAGYARASNAAALNTVQLLGSEPTGHVRSSAAVTLRFFGQSLGVGFARPLDYPAEWRWILELGQRF